jgi:hypothetical protein
MFDHLFIESSDQVVKRINFGDYDPKKKTIKFKSDLKDSDFVHDFGFHAMFAADLKAYKESKKTGKSRKIKYEEVQQHIPSNIKQFTLPDGSVVCVNTDETEFSEESVIDSITKTK